MNLWAILTIFFLGGSVGYIVVYEMGGNDWCRERAAVGGRCGDGLSGGGYWSGASGN